MRRFIFRQKALTYSPSKIHSLWFLNPHSLTVTMMIHYFTFICTLHFVMDLYIWAGAWVYMQCGFCWRCIPGFNFLLVIILDLGEIWHYSGGSSIESRRTGSWRSLKESLVCFYSSVFDKFLFFLGWLVMGSA